MVVVTATIAAVVFVSLLVHFGSLCAFFTSILVRSLVRCWSVGAGRVRFFVAFGLGLVFAIFLQRAFSVLVPLTIQIVVATGFSLVSIGWSVGGLVVSARRVTAHFWTGPVSVFAVVGPFALVLLLLLNTKQR